MYELGPANGSLTVHTGRAGLAARAGHDLVIDVERWSATLELHPDDSGRSRLQATIDATSLRVRDGLGGVKPLTDSDRADIQKTISEKVLASARFPEIQFESSAIHGMELRRWRVEGQLTLAGTTAPVQITVEAEPDGTETLLRATVPVVQTSFGIKPYSGMMGALKVADEVQIRAQARIPLAADAS